MSVRTRMEAILEYLDGPPQQPKADGLPDVKQKDTLNTDYMEFWAKQRAASEKKLEKQDGAGSSYYNRYMRFALPGQYSGGSRYGPSTGHSAPWRS